MSVRDPVRELVREPPFTRLQAVTDALPTLVSYVDSAQRYRFVNRAQARWFGRSRASFHGKHLREVLGDDTYAAIRPAVEHALAGETMHFESRLPQPHAGTRDVEVRYVPDVHEGRVLGFVALAEDVTERRSAELALRDSERRFRDLADQAPVMVWVTEADGRCSYLSRSWHAFTGQEPEFVQALEPQRVLMMPEATVGFWEDELLDLVALA